MKEGMKKAAEAASKASSNMSGGPEGPANFIPIIGGLLGTSLLGYLGYNAIYNVDGGHRAIIYNRVTGIQDSIKAEGTHFLIPWFERPVIYDVRTKPRTIASLTGSRDLQMVNINLRVLTRPSEPALPEIYRKLGTDYDERVLPSIVNEVLKQVVAQFNAAQLLTQRDNVSRLIRRNLEERAKEFHIVLEDVSIIDLTFGRDFTEAVENKQVAQQDAERARYIVDKALQEAKSIVIKAEGEAKSATLIGDAINENPGFVQLRRIDTAQEIAQSIARSNNRIYLNADALLINLLATSETPTKGEAKVAKIVNGKK